MANRPFTVFPQRKDITEQLLGFDGSENALDPAPARKRSRARY